jgi:hypothetical protein
MRQQKTSAGSGSNHVFGRVRISVNRDGSYLVSEKNIDYFSNA